MTTNEDELYGRRSMFAEIVGGQRSNCIILIIVLYIERRPTLLVAGGSTA